MPQRTEKTEPDAPPNCAVLPEKMFAGKLYDVLSGRRRKKNERREKWRLDWSQSALCEKRACRWEFDKATTAAQTASISARQQLRAASGRRSGCFHGTSAH